jgi:hypothetical protein
MVEEVAGGGSRRRGTPLLMLWRCMICGFRWDWIIEINHWRNRQAPARIVARKLLADLFRQPSPV